MRRCMSGIAEGTASIFYPFRPPHSIFPRRPIFPFVCAPCPDDSTAVEPVEPLQTATIHSPTHTALQLACVRWGASSGGSSVSLNTMLILSSDRRLMYSFGTVLWLNAGRWSALQLDIADRKRFPSILRTSYSP